MTPLALSRGRRRCRLAPTHYNDARQWRPTSRLYFLRVMPAGLAWAGVVNQFTDTMRDHGAEGDLWAVRALQAPRPFVGLLPRLSYTSHPLQHDPCPRGGYARAGSAGELHCSEQVHSGNDPQSWEIPFKDAILKGSRIQHPWRGCGLRAVRYCELPLLPQQHISWFIVVGLQHCTKEESGEGQSDRVLVERPDAIRNPPKIMTGWCTPCLSDGSRPQFAEGQSSLLRTIRNLVE
jgi:hypothetical protein